MALPINGNIYTFRCAASSTRLLNLFYQNGIKNGQNVCLWGKDGSLEQQWKYSNGKLLSMRGTGFALDKYTVTGNALNNNADIWTANDDVNQKIVFESVSGNTVRIRLASSQLYLTAYSDADCNVITPTKLGTAGNVYWAAKNNSSFQQWVFAKVGGGSDSSGSGQKLIFPFDTQYYTVGYKNDAPAYEVNFSYGPHYANDMFASGSTSVKASGNGTIVGTDSFYSLGNVMAVQYDNVIDRNGRNIGSIILRYCHLNSFSKTSGSVRKGEVIATEGASGVGAGSGKRVHLHLEADRDIDYPMATPTENGGVDTTIDPLSFLYRTSSQTVKPDSALGNASTDSKGNAWYNISKINNTPVI